MTTILVVDDEPALREVLATLFREEGFTVATAEDGLEALLLQRRRPADLILTDVNMPLVEGVELVEELRENGDQTPVILMSSSDTRVGDLSHVSSLRKPFDLDTVLELVTGMFVVPSEPIVPGERVAEPVLTTSFWPAPDPIHSSSERIESLRSIAKLSREQLTRSFTAAEATRQLLRNVHGVATRAQRAQFGASAGM